MTHTLEYTELLIEKKGLEVNLGDVLGFLSGHGEEIDQHTLDVTRKMITDCRKVMTPRGGFVVAEALPGNHADEISLQGKLFFTGKTIVKMLKGSRYYVFFIITLGPGPEDLARNLMEQGQFLEGYIVDLLASNLVDSAAQYVQDHVKDLFARKGLKITNRYSPGYCGWRVEEQQKLFSLFPEGSCGISLSASSLMSPIKSVSCLLGAGPDVSFRDYNCELCSMKDCSYRKTRPPKN